jgi:hypothetical protein
MSSLPDGRAVTFYRKTWQLPLVGGGGMGEANWKKIFVLMSSPINKTKRRLSFFYSTHWVHYICCCSSCWYTFWDRYVLRWATNLEITFGLVAKPLDMRQIQSIPMTCENVFSSIWRGADHMVTKKTAQPFLKSANTTVSTFLYIHIIFKYKTLTVLLLFCLFQPCKML